MKSLTSCKKSLKILKGLIKSRISNRQAMQWPRETGQKNKQWSTKHYTEN